MLEGAISRCRGHQGSTACIAWCVSDWRDRCGNCLIIELHACMHPSLYSFLSRYVFLSNFELDAASFVVAGMTQQLSLLIK
jgi:hypothetical protein